MVEKVEAFFVENVLIKEYNTKCTVQSKREEHIRNNIFFYIIMWNF